MPAIARHHQAVLAAVALPTLRRLSRLVVAWPVFPGSAHAGLLALASSKARSDTQKDKGPRSESLRVAARPFRVKGLGHLRFSSNAATFDRLYFPTVLPVQGRTVRAFTYCFAYNEVLTINACGLLGCFGDREQTGPVAVRSR